MSDSFDDGPDSPEAERHREAIVEMANLTNGMMGGIFDGARGSRASHKAPGSVSLYWQRLRKPQRIILVGWSIWIVGLFATAILITVHALPLLASIWLFLAAIALGGYQGLYLRSLRYLPPAERPTWVKHGSE